MIDCCGRKIDYLRISVTDRCNLRCTYCMPESGTRWMDHSQILTYEEILRLARLLAGLGIRRVRLTGGEPLVRRDLEWLVAGLKEVPGIRWVGLTTNGVLLEEQLSALVKAGLDCVNISLDTLDPAQYQAITRRDSLEAALRGLAAARAVPGLTVKVNCVLAGDNRDQWVSLARLAQDGPPLDVRFIELMPIGLGRSLETGREQEVLTRLEEAFGPAVPGKTEADGGPAHYVSFRGFTGSVGFISAMSHRFCGKCNRVRLTAGGLLKPCLQYDAALDAKALLRSGADDRELSQRLREAIYQKPAGHHFSDGRMPGDEGHNMNEIGG